MVANIKTTGQQERLMQGYLVYDQNFLGEGVVDREGGSSEGCLKWGGGGGGHQGIFPKTSKKEGG